MQLTSACEQFLSHCQYTKQLSHHTISAYQRDLTEFTKFYGPGKNLELCTRKDLQAYVAYLFETRELKATSVKRRLACLKAMFRWMEVEDLLPDNPFRKLDLPIRLPARLPKGLSSREIKRLLKQPIRNLGLTDRSQLDRATILSLGKQRQNHVQLTTLLSMEILFSTGIRVGELVSIRQEDLDLNDTSILIHGKGNRERLVYLPDPGTIQLLKAYIKLPNCQKPPDTPIITTSLTKPADTQYIRMLIRQIGEQAKLQRRVTPHMFRHTTATQLLEAGLDIRFVQKLLGHESITTTQIYTQVSNNKMKILIRNKHPICTT